MDMEVVDHEDKVMRKADLRVFVLSGEETKVWKSGLTRFTRNPDSISSNLNYAYDNVILLRYILGTETLSYMELAVNGLERAKEQPAVMVELHKILDYILAFWARIDDDIDSEQIRTVIKDGRYLERLNLYLRLRKGKEDMVKPFHMLVAKLRKGYLTYDKDVLESLAMNVTGDEIDYLAAIRANESLIKEQYKCIV